MRLALYQPDIPQNTGTIMRMAACLGIAVDIIEPCGFLLDDRRLRRSGMTYLELVNLIRHASWTDFYQLQKQQKNRLILFTTKGDTSFYDFRFQPNDILLMGCESAGVPQAVHQEANTRLRIPMVKNVRSLNVAMAAAMAVCEALRQIKLSENDPKVTANFG